MRSRLLLLIAIPTVTALVLGGVRIASATQSALAFQRAEERAVLAADVTQLAQRLETERDQTIYFIALGSERAARLPGPAAPPPASKSLPQSRNTLPQSSSTTRYALPRSSSTR